MHQTILLILLVPLISILPSKVIIIIHALSFLLIPVFIYFSSQILIGMANIAMNEHYLGYGEKEAQGGATTFLTLIELISLFCLISLYNKLLKNDNKILKKLYCMLPLFTVFAPLIMHNGSMIRISQYFHIYILILFPYSLEIFFKEKDSKVIYITSIAILICLTMI